MPNQNIGDILVLEIIQRRVSVYYLSILIGEILDAGASTLRYHAGAW